MAETSQELVPCTPTDTTHASQQDLTNIPTPTPTVSWDPHDHPLTASNQCEDVLTAISKLNTFIDQQKEKEYQYAAQHSYQFEQQHKKFVWFSTAAIVCSALSLIPLLGIFSFLLKIAAMIAAIIFLILAIRHNRQLAQARENDKHTNSIVDKNIEIIQQTQRTAILQCDGLLSLIPDDYQSADAINYMLKMIKVGRATTFAEATREWDEEAHRRRIEELQNQQLQSQLRQEKYAKQTRNIQAINLAATINNGRKLDDINDKLD
ncbi:MAG: hypothetical protein J5965_13860 [Aeriscardovia sp.]|nr:hypothetical protein [Aeriscardovia sp.]